MLADGPFNTYTRAGLPPTPIAMPGLASIRAAVNPEPTKALYFVARGDGSSVFSESLVEHNRAVNLYQRGSDAHERARFITFEGIDGAGKSSHIESLATGCAPAAKRCSSRESQAARRWRSNCARNSCATRWTR